MKIHLFSLFKYQWTPKLKISLKYLFHPWKFDWKHCLSRQWLAKPTERQHQSQKNREGRQGVMVSWRSREEQCGCCGPALRPATECQAVLSLVLSLSCSWFPTSLWLSCEASLLFRLIAWHLPFQGITFILQPCVTSTENLRGTCQPCLKPEWTVLPCCCLVIMDSFPAFPPLLPLAHRVSLFLPELLKSSQHVLHLTWRICRPQPFVEWDLLPF